MFSDLDAIEQTIGKPVTAMEAVVLVQCVHNRLVRMKRYDEQHPHLQVQSTRPQTNSRKTRPDLQHYRINK